MIYLVSTGSTMGIMPEVLHLKGNIISLLMVFSLFHLLTVDEKGEQFQRQASFPLFLLSYLRYIFTKFFFEDLQLSSFFCQRTASPLTDCSSITNLITSHSIFAVRFFLCLPTSAEEMIEESLSPHWVTSGNIESCHRFSWFNAALLNQISTDQVAGPVEAMGTVHGN